MPDNKPHALGTCPKCGGSWCADAIPTHLHNQVRPPYYFSHLIAVTIRGRGDRVNAYQCPHCAAEFDRSEIVPAPADFVPSR